MKASKDIRVYGTLLNYTLDPNKSNGDIRVDNDAHNDALANAYQLYDERFGESNPINNYQDVINKRLTAISYADTNGGVTTIENRDGSTGHPYVLIVKGNTNIKGDLYVDGDIYYKDDNGDTHKIDLSELMDRIAALESMWEINPNDATQIIAKTYNGTRRSAAAYGFYDTDPAMS